MTLDIHNDPNEVIKAMTNKAWKEQRQNIFKTLELISGQSLNGFYDAIDAAYLAGSEEVTNNKLGLEDILSPLPLSKHKKGKK